MPALNRVSQIHRVPYCRQHLSDAGAVAQVIQLGDFALQLMIQLVVGYGADCQDNHVAGNLNYAYGTVFCRALYSNHLVLDRKSTRLNSSH